MLFCLFDNIQSTILFTWKCLFFVIPLASFLGERQITVNAVAPGGLDDDFNSGLFEQMSGAKDFISSSTAVGRIGKPDDIGGVIAFLCSPQASFISGAVIPIDGGYHL